MKTKILSAMLICTFFLSACGYSPDDTSGTAYTTNTTTQKRITETNPVTEAETVLKQNDISVPYESFRYSQLTDDEKKAYDEIYAGLSTHAENIEIMSNVDKESLHKVYEAILTSAEFAMYCPTRAYKYTYIEDTECITSLTPEYKYTPDEEAEIRQKTQEIAASVMSMISSEMTDMDKIKVFHDYIIKNCEYYDKILTYSDEEIDQIMSSSYYDNAYGALVRHAAVCEGYSRAFRYLCLLGNIKCELISGTADGEEHMWNIICINNEWYHIDLTWDDPIMNEVQEYDNVSYSYFNLNDDKISADHVTDDTIFTYPECTAVSAEYYHYYNMFATDKESAVEILKREILEYGNDTTQIKILQLRADSAETFSEINDYLFSDELRAIYEIFDEVNKQLDAKIETQKIARTIDDENHIITLILL